MILKRNYNCIALWVVILSITVISATSCENKERKEFVQLVEEWQNKEIFSLIVLSLLALKPMHYFGAVQLMLHTKS